MKKSLIALAALASTGAVMAQSSVTLYGIVDVNLQVKSVGSVRQTALESGGVSGSRWGIKGSEDLGGGLKANFVLESGFTIDDGKGSTKGLFNRQSYVGLSGGFGEVQLGNSFTPLDDINGAANAVFDSILSPTAGTSAGGVAFQGGYVSNPLNQIKYLSPSFGGVSGAVSYALGENKTATTSAKNVFGLNVQYTGGPLYVGYAYQNDKKYNAPLTTKHNLVNATYDLGMAKLLASYRDVKNTDQGDDKEKTFQVGVDVPVGPSLVVSAGFAHAIAESAGVADRKTNGYAVGASYSLSKRTSVYTGINLTRIKQATARDHGNLVAVGIRHAF